MLSILALWLNGTVVRCRYKLIQKIETDAVSVGLIMASTDALGAAYAFNNPSNALIRNTRGSQFRPGFLKNSSIQDAVSGYGVTLDGDMFHVSVAQLASDNQWC
ncbi:MAG: hypothetical protein Q9N62_11960 [Ghiorsea sp.]|nr:hypothetical protein [Ghiorsea sp.]